MRVLPVSVPAVRERPVSGASVGLKESSGYQPSTTLTTGRTQFVKSQTRTLINTVIMSIEAAKGVSMIALGLITWIIGEEMLNRNSYTLNKPILMF